MASMFYEETGILSLHKRFLIAEKGYLCVLHAKKKISYFYKCSLKGSLGNHLWHCWETPILELRN